MDHFAYLSELADRQETPLRVRRFENKNVIIRRNLANDQGLITAVWDAWLRRELRSFGGFEPVIEIDNLGAKKDVRFFSERQLAEAVHYILRVDDPVAV
ncbi:hypothetical protein [Lacticaseibacillus daqingensis]|uniref:hypothetical protein n=1 Tax=Lacticaseibacillus daqingensis TaxID=2486014 RepID=UPI000F7861AC|nr:hypothetical protein [Lacticaseibacillus daqingensis]